MNHPLPRKMLHLVGALILVASILAVYQPAAAQTAPVSDTPITFSSTGTAPSSSSIAPVSSDQRPTYPAAVEAARAALAARLGMRAQDITVVGYKYVVWTDSCLGIHHPGEGCLTVMTPGYDVVLRALGRTYEAHTDLTGKNIRWVSAPATTQ